jgi:uncharacterized protein YkwD
MRTAFTPRPGLLLAFLMSTGVATMQPAGRLMASENPQTSAQGVRGQTGVVLSSTDPANLNQDNGNATVKPVAATVADIPFSSASSDEQELLELANQARRQTGAPALTLDSGLSQAARVHAQAMLEAHELSHQFNGEASLPQRLGIATRLQLDQEGENVALDYTAESGHQHLMLSPPHRASLLNPAYNVVGLGVVRSGDQLYIVQDFGHALPRYSAAEVKDRIESAVNQTRRRSGQRELQRRDLLIADDAACSMADADKLGTTPVRKLAERYTVMTFTSLHPETLPSGAVHALASRDLRAFSIGACYARTDTYPTGVYWVVVSVE